MHLWQSKHVLKTNKQWHPEAPKGLNDKEIKEFRAEERLNKQIKLGIYVKEKRVDNKTKKD